MNYNEDLLEKVPANYDVNKIGFILLSDDSSSDIKDSEIQVDGGAKPSQSAESASTCGVCDRVFYNRSNLRRHLNTVHSIKYVECELCDLTFNSRRELTFHMKKQHPKVDVICDFCGEVLNTKEELIKHLQIHQGLDMDIDDMLLDF